MDHEEMDWIRARFVLSSILGRNALVVDHDDEESFPVDDRSTRRTTPAPAPTMKIPPPTRATEEVEGTVCVVCTDEITSLQTMTQLPCSHCYHAECISPWLGINSTCPMCRRELPREGSEGSSRAKPRAQVAASGVQTSILSS